MEKPPSALRQSAGESPAFDELTPPADLVSGGRTRDDFFDAVLGLDSPATVSEVATLAGHGTDAAREYLEWFERMGIVTQLTDSPATYKRNQTYLNWRRVQQLREEYAPEKLVELLQTESERAKEFQTEFDADAPDEVSITAFAEATEQPLAEVWEQLSAWKTTRRRIELLEQALDTTSGGAVDHQRAV